MQHRTTWCLRKIMMVLVGFDKEKKLIAVKKNFAFPFAVTDSGNISASGGDDAIRAKIIQVLFTAPGERVHQPEFGCGLLNLIFDSNDQIRAAALEFTINQALIRWMADEIAVQQINVRAEDEKMLVELVYKKTQDLREQAVRISFK